LRRLLVPALALVALGLAGCSEKTPGTALPGNDATTTTTTTTTEEPTTEESTETSEPQGSPLADVAPCELLTEQGAAALGAGAGAEREVGEARTCRWRVEGATLDDSFTLDVALYEERGVGDVQGTNVARKTIGSHDAVTFTDPTGLCVVSIATGETSRADTLATGGDAQRGCQLAAQLADLVEPQLP
jgi:hypothetical protein